MSPIGIFLSDLREFPLLCFLFGVPYSPFEQPETLLLYMRVILKIKLSKRRIRESLALVTYNI